MTGKNRKILILHGPPGMGHVMPAKAIMSAFLRKYPEIETRDADAFDFCYKIFRTVYVYFYSFSVSSAPVIFKIFYNSYKSQLAYKFFEKLAAIFINKNKLVSFIKDFSPDFIIATNPLGMQQISLVKEENIASILSGNSCTDFGFHPIWYSPDVNYYFVASENIKNSLVLKGVEPANIKITGIPIREKFSHKINKNNVLKNLRLDASKPVLLIVGGQLKYNDLLKIIKEIKIKNNSVQFIVVAGRDKFLYEKIKKSGLEKDSSLRIFGLSDNIEELMAASDLIFSKAGGSTTAECMAMGLPMVVFKETPGHEEDNVNFLVSNKVGIKVKNISEASEKICELFSEPAEIQKMKKRCKELARPGAADDVAEFIASKLNQN